MGKTIARYTNVWTRGRFAEREVFSGDEVIGYARHMGRGVWACCDRFGRALPNALSESDAIEAVAQTAPLS